jgi:DNA processing protein
VGTRQATAEALSFTRTLAAELGAQGYSVWSGGALGIDHAAHLGALEAGVPTVLVAPTGLDHPYPKQHAELYGRVLAQGGALLSLWPDHTLADRPRFLQRNFVLAALTLATVVVQAPVRSGARNTARAARSLGRLLCVVPQAPWCTLGAGCVCELRRGARPVRNAADVVDALEDSRFLLSAGPGARPRAEGRAKGARAARQAALDLEAGEKQALGPKADSAAIPAGHAGRSELGCGPGRLEKDLDLQDLSDHERAALAALGPRPQHLDEVCEATGRPAGAMAQALLTLTLRAIVVEGPAGQYRRRRG